MSVWLDQEFRQLCQMRIFWNASRDETAQIFVDQTCFDVLKDYLRNAGAGEKRNETFQAALVKRKIKNQNK